MTNEPIQLPEEIRRPVLAMLLRQRQEVADTVGAECRGFVSSVVATAAIEAQIFAIAAGLGLRDAYSECCSRLVKKTPTDELVTQLGALERKARGGR